MLPFGPTFVTLPVPAWGGRKGLFAAMAFHIVLKRFAGMMLPAKGVRDRLPAAKLPVVEAGS